MRTLHVVKVVLWVPYSFYFPCQNKIKNKSKESFPGRIVYEIERDPLFHHRLSHHTAKPSPTLPSSHFIPSSFIKFSPQKVKMKCRNPDLLTISETITLLLRERRKHENEQKNGLDLFNLALLEWEPLKKAENYFYIFYSYNFYVV